MKWFEMFEEFELVYLYSAVGIESTVNRDDNSGYKGGDIG
jgi:hypothetical protein